LTATGKAYQNALSHFGYPSCNHFVQARLIYPTAFVVFADAAVKAKEAAEKKQVTADGEIQKYKQLYIQERGSKSDLISQISLQKSEAKRWQGKYNNLYRQHVQLKRNKGLSIE